MDKKNYEDLKGNIEKFEGEVTSILDYVDERIYALSVYAFMSNGSANKFDRKNQRETIIKNVAKAFIDRYNPNKGDAIIQNDDLIRNALKEVLEENKWNRKLEEERMWASGEATGAFYAERCGEISDLYNRITTYLEEFEGFPREKKSEYREIQLECENIIRKLENIDTSIKWMSMIEGSISDEDTKEICGNAKQLQKALEIFYKANEKLSIVINKYANDKQIEDEDTYVNIYKQEMGQLSDEKSEDLSKKMEWMTHFWNGWLCEYIKGRFVLHSCYCTRTNKEIEKKDIESFIELCRSYDKIKRDNYYYEERIINFCNLFRTVNYDEKKRQITYPKSAEIPLVIWIVFREKGLDQIRFKLIDVVKDRKIYTKSKGNCFSKANLMKLINKMIETEEIHCSGIRYDFVCGMNELFGVTLVNEVVGSLFKKNLITKAMVDKFEEDYNCLAGDLDIWNRYYKRFEDLSWVEHADFFELISFMCVYFIEVGRNVSWVFALDFAQSIVETFLMLFDKNKQPNEIVTWAFRKLIYALAPFPIIYLYEEYEKRLREYYKDDPMLYFVLGESRKTIYSSREDMLKNELKRQRIRYDQENEVDEKQYENRSVSNRLYKLLFQMVFLLLNS